MWDDLREDVAAEREELRELLASYRTLLRECPTRSPSEIERAALAAMLHSLYTGIENILKWIAPGVDGVRPRGESWHRDLLGRMARPEAHRPAVVSSALHRTLQDLLDFRHRFRNLYTFRLEWDRMADLALGSERTLAEFERELDLFFASAPGPGSAT